MSPKKPMFNVISYLTNPKFCLKSLIFFECIYFMLQLVDRENKNKILKWSGSFFISSNTYYFPIKKNCLYWTFDKYCFYVVPLKQLKDFLLTTDCLRLFSYVFFPFSWTELAGRWNKYVTNSTWQYKKCTNLLKTEYNFSDCTLRLILK